MVISGVRTTRSGLEFAWLLVSVVAIVAICSCAAPPRPQLSEEPTDCNQAPHEAVLLVDLPGRPFQALPTSDGCWIFVSLTQSRDEPARIAVLSRSAGSVEVVREIQLETTPLGEPPSGLAPSGMVLTHDGELLIAAAGRRLAYLDVGHMLEGSPGAVLGYWEDEVETPNRVYVNVTTDDRYLFVSEERAGTIAVIDLAKTRQADFETTALVGKIPAGQATIALTFSRDERYLFSTIQAMPVDEEWPCVCKPQQRASEDVAPDHAHGAVVVIDVARATTRPQTAVLARVPAGCNPVRLVTSPDGVFAYVSARNSDALLVFDTEKLASDPENALVAEVPVGRAPVGVAVIDGGRKLVVGNSNMFAGGVEDRQSLTVIDAARIEQGASAVIGSIPAGAYPRELRLTDDGRTLLVANFRSRTLQLVDVERLS
jgi:DNA-binding beta-propeller fold protein YncE